MIYAWNASSPVCGSSRPVSLQMIRQTTNACLFQPRRREAERFQRPRTDSQPGSPGSGKRHFGTWAPGSSPSELRASKWSHGTGPGAGIRFRVSYVRCSVGCRISRVLCVLMQCLILKRLLYVAAITSEKTMSPVVLHVWWNAHLVPGRDQVTLEPTTDRAGWVNAVGTGVTKTPTRKTGHQHGQGHIHEAQGTSLSVGKPGSDEAMKSVGLLVAVGEDDPPQPMMLFWRAFAKAPVWQVPALTPSVLYRHTDHGALQR